jgi:hypothetical protein
MSHLIKATFETAGRGTIVAIEEKTELPVAKQLQATITRPDGSKLSAPAVKEWLLVRSLPLVVEQEAYLVKEISKLEIPEGSSVEVSEL